MRFFRLKLLPKYTDFINSDDCTGKITLKSIRIDPVCIQIFFNLLKKGIIFYHLHGQFWIYVSIYAANNRYFIDKDEHIIKIIVHTTWIISMRLKIVSIYGTDLVNVAI